jgi:heme exporter protein C
MKSLNLNFVLGWMLALATLSLMAFYVPPRIEILENNYLIFFYHFPSAIDCLVFFLIAGVASAVHLVTGSQRSDQVAQGAVEVGLLACTITLVTGSIWAKAAWGHYWIWTDPRLVAVAIMWFTYLGYLSLRVAIETPVQRTRFAAVFGVIAAANIPIVWYAPTWFQKRNHPRPQEMIFDASMRITMWFGALSFFVLYLAFMRLRARVARVREEAERLEETLVLGSDG